MQFHGKLLDMTDGVMEKIWIYVILINSFWNQVLMSAYQKNKITSEMTHILVFGHSITDTLIFNLISSKMGYSMHFGFIYDIYDIP